MNTETKPPTNEETRKLAYAETAAPHAGSALYFRHPTEGWLPVLDTHTHIEVSLVLVVLGDPKTGAYSTTYRTDYANTEELLFSDGAKAEIGGPTKNHDWPDITRSTPGESNLNEYHQ